MQKAFIPSADIQCARYLQQNKPKTLAVGGKTALEDNMTAEKRTALENMSREYINSPYRRKREYGAYLDRFLNAKDRAVDGMEYEARQGKEPMPYNLYFS